MPNQDGFAVQRCNGTLATCNQSAANFVDLPGSPLSGQDAALLAFWHMDETSWSGVADEVVDSSGNGNHGTARNGADIDRPGKVGASAALLAGVDYVSTNLMLDQSGTTPGATFMAWVYPTVQDGNYQYIVSTDNGGVDWGLSIRNGYWYVDTGNAVTYATSVTLNAWQHVAVVFNPVAGVQLFVNGTLRNTITDIGFDVSTSPINIGRHPTSGSYFTGRIDELAVFSRPLASSEVTKYYNNTRPITLTDTDGITLSSTYNYRIKPLVNTACGDWAASASYGAVSATSPAAPPAPDTLAVTQKGSTELDLSWNDKTTTESAFIIERCQGTACNFTTMDTFQVGAGVTTYQDTSVCQGTIYRYRLKAVKGTAFPWEWETAYSTAVEKSTMAATARPGRWRRSMGLRIVERVWVCIVRNPPAPVPSGINTLPAQARAPS